jgi:hypothetical protein
MTSAVRKGAAAATPLEQRGFDLVPLRTAVLIAALLLCCATAAPAQQWYYGTDAHPQRIAAGAWRFRIPVPVPVGNLYFANSQYDFARPTQHIAVDYAYNGSGDDFVAATQCLAIAPTLYDALDGYLYGWDVSDLRDGWFAGTVQATTTLTAVHFSIMADGLIQTKGGDGHAKAR